MDLIFAIVGIALGWVARVVYVDFKSKPPTPPSIDIGRGGFA